MAEDPRWIFLQEIVQKTLNVKADKWAKFCGNEGMILKTRFFFFVQIFGVYRIPINYRQ